MKPSFLHNTFLGHRSTMTPTTLERDVSTTDTRADDYQDWYSVEYQAPRFGTVINQELDKLALLTQNWDAEGAPPMDPKIIEATRDFISKLPQNIASTPAVVPSGAGNLQLEWHEGPRSLGLEVETISMIHYLFLKSLLLLHVKGFHSNFCWGGLIYSQFLIR